MQDAIKFLQQIIPSGGRYVGFIAGETKGRGRNISANSPEELVAQLMANNTDRNVYFAPASYGEGKGRKKTDVVSLRALWFDIDAHGDGKGYDTVDEAAQAALDGAAALGLPKPILVWTGGGVQGWYIFRGPLEQELWTRLARALKRGLHAVGVRLDPTRTADAASIMRLPGSFNHNRGATAYIIDDGEPTRQHDATAFEIALTKHGAAVHTVTDNAKPVRVKPTRYPKHNKDAALILADCAQIRHFKETGSEREPHWHSSASVLAACMDGEKLFHEWSSIYQGYSSEEAQAKFDAALEKDAPHTCDTFSKHNDLCEGCPFWGKIKSPVELGQLRSPPAPVVSTPSGEEIDFDAWNKELPDGFLINDDLQLVQVEGSEEGPKHTLVCDMPIRLTGVAKDEDSNKKYAALQQYNIGEGELEHNIISIKDLTGPAGMGEIRNFGAAVFRPDLLGYYITSYIAKFNRLPRMADLYKSFGWKREGFLIGQTLYTKEGPKPAALQPDSFASSKATELQPGGGRRLGSLEGWKEAILPCLQPGCEFQLDALVAAFASVLMGLLAPTEGGVIRSLYSPRTGPGKTTASQLSQSVWGLERALQITATASEITRANIWSGAGGLPTYEDESIRQDAQQVKDRVTAFTLGMNKQRSGRDGKVLADRDRRSSVHIVTANTSMIAALSQYQGSDAMQARVFETEVPVLPIKKTAKLLAQLTQNPGWAGPIFLSFVMSNLRAVTKALQGAQAYFADMFPGAEFRYKVNYLACASVAAAIINKLGLVRFDQTRYTDWLQDEVKKEAGFSKVETNEDILREFFDATRDKTLSVTHSKMGNVNKVDLAAGAPTPRETIVKRHEVTKERMIISRKALTDFLANYSAAPKGFIAWMQDAGFIVSAETVRDLTEGVATYDKGRERVIIMDLKKWKLDNIQN